MRNKDLLSIRPVLPLETAHSEPLELFQNTTLRPILKMQHDLFFLMYKQYIVLRKNTFYTLKPAQKKLYIEESIKKDIKFKNRLLGIVIGHFTEEEYLFFISNEEELTRRLTQLLIQRIISMLQDLSIDISQME